MNNYINHRMMIWSEWEIRKDQHGLGYPKQCSYTRLALRSGGAGYQPDFDSDAYEIAQIMVNIKKIDQRVHRVLHLFYDVDYDKKGKAVTRRMTKEMIAQDLQCHRDTVYTLFSRGERLILDALHENDALAHVR